MAVRSPHSCVCSRGERPLACAWALPTQGGLENLVCKGKEPLATDNDMPFRWDRLGRVGIAFMPLDWPLSNSIMNDSSSRIVLMQRSSSTWDCIRVSSNTPSSPQLTEARLRRSQLGSPCLQNQGGGVPFLLPRCPAVIVCS